MRPRTSSIARSACASIARLVAVVFLVPFAFIVLTAVKDRAGGRALDFSWPTQLPIVENFTR